MAEAKSRTKPAATRRAAGGMMWLLAAIVLAAMLAACGSDDITALPEGASPGPQTNLPKSLVTNGGWSECYSDTYDVTGVALSTILSQCSGTYLLLACAPVGSTELTVAAAAHRDDVTFVTPADTTTTHQADGTAWYFNDDRSWGYAVPGDGVNKSTCDTATGSHPEKRLCWHTSLGSLATGWRCGTTTSLNSNTGWERFIYHRS